MLLLLLLLPPCARRAAVGRLSIRRARPFSSLFIPPPPREHVAIPCRSNGLVTLDVYHASTPNPPLLIYLPPGPVLPDYAEEEKHVISALSTTSGATVVRINYRASPNHPFPTPLHDVLLGHDWLKENLLHHGSSRPVVARVGVCGQLMGGSLATMLALTECRRGEVGIGAAAVNNPIADWVFPDDLPVVPPSELVEPLRPEETAFPADEDPMASSLPEETRPSDVPNAATSAKLQKQSKRTPKQAPPTSWQLYGDNTVIPTVTLSGERDVLFRRPQDYFDRFASPIHFFRSPHGALLLPSDDDASASEQPETLLDIETQLDLNHYHSAEAANSPAVPEVPTLVRCRAYARIYPPAEFHLNLPVWHITTGLHSPLLDQGTELAKMVRRSIARLTLKRRTGRSRWHDAAEKEYYEEYANGRVHVDSVDGIGLWTQQDDQANWKEQVERVGAFMKETLKHECT